MVFGAIIGGTASGDEFGTSFHNIMVAVDAIESV